MVIFYSKTLGSLFDITEIVYFTEPSLDNNWHMVA